MNEIVTIAKALVALGCMDPDKYAIEIPHNCSIVEEEANKQEKECEDCITFLVHLSSTQSDFCHKEAELKVAKKKIECEKLEEKMVKAVKNAK